MDTNGLELLAKAVLPEEVLTYFEIIKVTTLSEEIHIHLDERASSELQHDIHFESKGFIEPVTITDFPIRGHKVLLIIRRRRWLDIRTGKSFILPIDIAAKGTRYSKEFAAFLKEAYGYLCYNLPNT